MAKLIFVATLLFALVNVCLPLHAQQASATLSVCNAGKVDFEVLVAKANAAVTTHIVPNACANVYSETAGVPASVGFAFTDARGQWGGARRLDLLPDTGNALERADRNVTVQRGNQSITAQVQLLFRPAIPHCAAVQIGSEPTRLGLGATPSEIARAENADAARPRGSVMVCDHFVYRLNAVAYPDTRELSFEKACSKCPLQEPVNIPISEAAAKQAMLDMARTGKTALPTAWLSNALNIQGQQRPEAQPVTWPVLLPALAKTGRTGGLPPGVPKYIVLRGTVSRVEESAPGASVHWVDVSFREAPDTPSSTGKMYGALNVCASNSDIFQDVFGADFRTSMIGKPIEVEGEIQRYYCQGLKGSIRVTLAHQVRVVKSALFDPATLAAVPAIVPAPDALPQEPYRDPSMPNYDPNTSGQILQYCRGLYDPPVSARLTAEQRRIQTSNRAPIEAEVQKCVAGFDATEVLAHRRIALRYCLGHNDYTVAGQSGRRKSYDECMYQNDVLTELCTRELKYRGELNRMPNVADQKCPAPSPAGQEIAVIKKGGSDDIGHPVVIPSKGPGLPAILLAPMEPGMIRRAASPVAVPAPPAPAPAKAVTPGEGAAPAPVAPVAAPAQQPKQQIADRQKRAQQYTACLQQAGKDYPRGSPALVKAVNACVQILQAQ